MRIAGKTPNLLGALRTKPPDLLSRSILCVSSMSTDLMGFESPVSNPETMKMSNQLPAEVKGLRATAAPEEDYAKPG